MKRRAYCCDASRHMYEDYYSRQAGGEMPVFAGSRYQRGHGLGSILGGFFRRFIVPMFKRHGKTLALDTLRTGMNVADDVLGSGQGFKESIGKRVPEGVQRTAQHLMGRSVPESIKRTTQKPMGQSGYSVRGRNTHKRRKTRLGANDIFA